jgi:hypothetical protein
LEEMQTLKHALGSFWESRPDQSAASMTPKTVSPWVQLCAYCRYWLLPYRDGVLRTLCRWWLSHELLMLFIARRHGLEEIGKSRIRWDLEMRPDYGSIEHWRLMQVMIMHVMRCCPMLDQTSKQRMKQGTQTILTRGVVLTDGWMETREAHVSCVLVPLEPLVVAETCGDHITAHIQIQVLPTPKAAYRQLHMSRCLNASGSQAAITAAPST